MLPLGDVRVIAVEQYGAGPFGSLHLADLGADVVKVEDPRTGGDVGRTVPPFAQGDDSLFFQTFNRNKRSIALDLSTAAGYGVLRDLVSGADAVYSNLRGDIPAKLRLTYDDLAEVNPRIVCCSLSGFGTDGPRAREPAYDYVLQALTGWMTLTGEPDGPPTKTGLSLVDYCGGIVAVLSLMAGVHAARRDGRGMDCDVSLFDAAIAMLTYPAAWKLNAGHEVGRTRQSAHPSLVPFQNFRTADGWVVIGCAKEKFWRRLCAALDRSDLAADPRFATFTDRREHAGALLAIVEPLVAQRSTDHWVEVLASAGVPCGPVQGIGQALEDPQAAARDLLVTVDHPVLGPLRLPRTAARVGRERPDPRPAPGRGVDTEELLTALPGYDAARIDRLRAEGAFGQVAGALR